MGRASIKLKTRTLPVICSSVQIFTHYKSNSTSRWLEGNRFCRVRALSKGLKGGVNLQSLSYSRK